MTESEWRNCQDPGPMVKFLQVQRERVGTWRGHLFTWLGRPPLVVSDRKLRLFVCDCCRRYWHLFTDERDRKAVEIAERHADGQAGDQDLRAATEVVFHRESLLPGEAPMPPIAYWAASACVNPSGTVGEVFDGQAPKPLHAVAVAVDAVAHTTVPAPCNSTDRMSAWRGIIASEFRKAADLLRDIIGNPFRPPPPPDAAWLAWGDGTVRKLAEAIYQERAFDRLPVLADALEEAGCGDADLLGHLRRGGVHARGCWAIDLLLGKE